MKNALILALFLVLVSCQSSGNESESGQEFDVQLDTVMIHPGEEILFLNWGLGQAKLTPDKKYLYNFNYQEYSIEKIDLDELKFVRKISLDKEGPNGVGANFRNLEMIGEDRFLFCSYGQDNIVNDQGKKVEQFDLGKLAESSGELEEGDYIQVPLSIGNEGQHFAGMVTNWEKKTAKLVLIDRETNQVTSFPAPEIEKAAKFEIMLNDGEMRMGLGTYRFGKAENGRMIFGTGVGHELYVLEPDTGEFQLVRYASEFLPPGKSGEYPAEVSSQAEMRNVHQKIQSDINFMGPVWDEQKGVFYRISFRMIYDDTQPIPEGRFMREPSGSHVYLTVLDEQFNPIREGKLLAMATYPPFHFAKDGKLWFFENIEDEMGFVRMDISW
ncbi:protein of unknown function [Cyclobacterium xiamenense]|uniref:DUF4221 domain-containing protein n=1 Tax=Cyclobacterium xiamenense TaxID=1297121 RepID=A0A1H6WE85_9BACT|nr:DUF4221 family protein [Cyclobacterium xiamenense]SEJ15341.1 protein of unknown function [Cyclobacterium xiamenense]